VGGSRRLLGGYRDWSGTKADVNARSKSKHRVDVRGAGRSRLNPHAARCRRGPESRNRDWKGTALGIASTMGQPDIVEALLNKGADINHRDDNSFTALHSLVRDSDYGEEREQRSRAVATVKVLLAHGADPKGANIEAMDSFRQTPLSISLSVLTKEAGPIAFRYRAGTGPRWPSFSLKQALSPSRSPGSTSYPRVAARRQLAKASRFSESLRANAPS
jgi:Ankyrin repeats (many copies)